MKRTRKLKTMSDDSVENIFANQIRLGRNRLRSLKAKLKKKGPDLSDDHPLVKEMQVLLEKVGQAKSNFKTYKSLNNKISEEHEKKIAAGNKNSKLSSITKQEISGGLPSLGKKR